MSSPHDSDADSDAYERARLDNIRANEALLRELDLKGGLSGDASVHAARKRQIEQDDAAAARKRRSSAQQAAAAKRRKQQGASKSAEREKERIQPRRVSSRLLGLEADSEALKRRYEEEAEAERQAQEAARRAKHEDYDLSRLTGGDLAKDELEGLSSLLAGSSSSSSARSRYGPRGRDAEAEVDPDDGAAELKSLLDRMELRASASKVTPKRIYTMAFHPRTDRDLVFAGDKEGCVGVWDPLAPNDDAGGGAEDDDDGGAGGEGLLPEGKSWSLQVHGRSPVTCLRVEPTSADSLFSCSYDATVRRLDLARGVSTEVWAGEEDVLLSIFDILSPRSHPGVATSGLESSSMWVADHRGGLIHVDLREPSGRAAKTASRRWQVCEKKIGAMAVNPLAPHCIATASLDQHFRLFDVRALASLPLTPEAPYNAKGVDLDRLESTLERAQLDASRAKLACTSVDFDATGTRLVGVSYDDVVKVWDLHPSWLSKDGAAAASDAPRAKATASSKPKVAASPAPRANGRRGVKKEEALEEQDEDVKGAAKARQPERRGGLFRWLNRSNSGEGGKDDTKSDGGSGVTAGQGEDEGGAAKTARGKDADASVDASDAAAYAEHVRDLVGSKFPSRPRPASLLGSPLATLRHNNQTGKWLTLFRARFHANPELPAHFCIGAMTRAAEVFDAGAPSAEATAASAGGGANKKRTSATNEVRLLRSLYDEEHVTAVPAVCAMHPVHAARLACGNASGKCHFWAPPPPARDS